MAIDFKGMQMLMKGWVKQGPQGLGGYCGHAAEDSTGLAHGNHGITRPTNMFVNCKVWRKKQQWSLKAFQLPILISTVPIFPVHAGDAGCRTVRNWDTALWFAAEWRQRGRSDVPHGYVAAVLQGGSTSPDLIGALWRVLVGKL